ncbi:MAG: hypothetical protein LBC30_03560 [Puniceicoccales bacterium]|jgi:S-adenosylmethionine synthetase|nr:hypothetical protein [Puniceicoccales bacterium]
MWEHMALGRSRSHFRGKRNFESIIMEDFSKADFKLIRDKLNIFEIRLEHLKAYIDQKFDEIDANIDDLISRINNLR